MPEDAAFEVLGFTFMFCAGIEPERDPDGSVREFMPQVRYAKAAETALNPWGHGPFCQFRVRGLPYGPGVYLLLVEDRIMYVGIGKHLADRFGPRNYGSIHPRNCYVGGQSTNCKVNHLILKAARDGEIVDIWVHETRNPAPIEARLISALRPPWNTQIPSA